MQILSAQNKYRKYTIVLGLVMAVVVMGLLVWLRQQVNEPSGGQTVLLCPEAIGYDCREVPSRSLSEEANPLVNIFLISMMAYTGFVFLMLVSANRIVKRLLIYIATMLTLIAPLVLMPAAAYVVGLFVVFAACYGEDCSQTTESVIQFLPVVVLGAVGLGLSAYLYRTRRQLFSKLHSLSAAYWLTGALIITVGAALFWWQIVNNF